MVIPASTQIALFGLTTAVLMWASVRSPRAFLAMVGFLIPLASMNAKVGINLFWFILVGPLAITLLPLAPRAYSLTRVASDMWIFLAYVAGLSCFWMVAEYFYLHRTSLATSAGLGSGQSTYRMPVQFFSFIFQSMALFVIPMRARNHGDVRAGFVGIGTGLVVSIIVGLLLSLAGIGMLNADVERTQIEVGGRNILRLSGLSNEPRHLGAFLVVAFPFGLAAFHSVTGRDRHRLVVAGSLCILGIFLTFSTSSWIGFATAICVYMMFSLFDRGRKRLAWLVLGAVVALLTVMSSAFVRDAVETRLQHRLEEYETRGGIQSQKDDLLLEVFEANPEHLILGFGLGGYDFEALPYALRRRYWDHGMTPTPTSTAGRFLGDLGLVGLLMFIAVTWRWARRVRATLGANWAAAIPMSLAGLFFVSQMAYTAFLFLCGGLLTAAHLRKAPPTSTSSHNPSLT